MSGSRDLSRGWDLGSVGMSRSVRSLESAARWLVVSSAAVAPWLFGASEPWASDLVSLVAFTGAMCWLIGVAACPPTRLRVRSLTAVLVLLLALMCLQIIPLPPWLANAVSSFSASVGRDGLDLLRALGLATDGEIAGWIPLSVAPGATRAATGLFAVYVLAFLVIANGTHHWTDLRRMAAVILGSGFTMVLVSLVHGLTHSRELFWFHVPRHMEYGFGPFANRNHFATHAILLFGLAAGMFLAAVTIPALRGAGWRERLLFLSTRGASRLAMLALVVVVTAATVFLSLSRGAIVSLMVAVGVAIAAWALSGNLRAAPRYAFVAALILVFSMVVWLGWRPIAERLSTLGAVARDPVADWRVMAASDTLALLGLSPILGCGFGSFQYVFPVVARPELHVGRWMHTHNDWVEWLAEGGVVGGLLVALALWFFLREVMRKMRGLSADRRLFVQGCLVGLAAVAIQSGVDFGLRKPANGLLFAVLAGLAVAALRRPSFLAAEPDAGSPQQEAPGPVESVGGGIRLRIAACLALVAVVMAWSGSAIGFQEALAFKRLEHLDRMSQKTDDPAMIEALVASARAEAQLCMGVGGRSPELLIEVMATHFRWAMDRRLSPATRRLLEEDTLRMASLPVRAAPTDFSGWLWLARGQAMAGRWSAVDRCMERAAELRPRGVPPRLVPYKP